MAAARATKTEFVAEDTAFIRDQSNLKKKVAEAIESMIGKGGKIMGGHQARLEGSIAKPADESTDDLYTEPPPTVLADLKAAVIKMKGQQVAVQALQLSDAHHLMKLADLTVTVEKVLAPFR